MADKKSPPQLPDLKKRVPDPFGGVKDVQSFLRDLNHWFQQSTELIDDNDVNSRLKSELEIAIDDLQAQVLKYQECARELDIGDRFLEPFEMKGTVEASYSNQTQRYGFSVNTRKYFNWVEQNAKLFADFGFDAAKFNAPLERLQDALKNPDIDQADREILAKHIEAVCK